MQDLHWLFKNHLQFLATHRGTVTRLPGGVTVESERPEFTYAVLDQRGDRTLLDRFTTAHFVPLEGLWAQKPEDPRLVRKGALSYMIHEGDPAAWRVNPRVEVRRVEDEAAMDVFSQVQANGFMQKKEDLDVWHPWLRTANHRNLGDPHQAFYVGWLEGKPVGTTLLVRTAGLGGIYAVATLPDARRQGVGTTLMAAAAADADAKGADRLTLQVAQGSPAEAMYLKMGFVTRFTAEIYSRTP